MLASSQSSPSELSSSLITEYLRKAMNRTRNQELASRILKIRQSNISSKKQQNSLQKISQCDQEISSILQEVHQTQKLSYHRFRQVRKLLEMIMEQLMNQTYFSRFPNSIISSLLEHVGEILTCQIYADDLRLLSLYILEELTFLSGEKELLISSGRAIEFFLEQIILEVQIPRFIEISVHLLRVLANLGERQSFNLKSEETKKSFWKFLEMSSQVFSLPNKQKFKLEFLNYLKIQFRNCKNTKFDTTQFKEMNKSQIKNFQPLQDSINMESMSVICLLKPELCWRMIKSVLKIEDQIEELFEELLWTMVFVPDDYCCYYFLDILEVGNLQMIFCSIQEILEAISQQHRLEIFVPLLIFMIKLVSFSPGSPSLKDGNFSQVLFSILESIDNSYLPQPISKLIEKLLYSLCIQTREEIWIQYIEIRLDRGWADSLIQSSGKSSSESYILLIILNEYVQNKGGDSNLAQYKYFKLLVNLTRNVEQFTARQLEFISTHYSELLKLVFLSSNKGPNQNYTKYSCPGKGGLQKQIIWLRSLRF